jgi:hypothetical protein
MIDAWLRQLQDDVIIVLVNGIASSKAINGTSTALSAIPSPKPSTTPVTISTIRARSSISVHPNTPTDGLTTSPSADGTRSPARRIDGHVILQPRRLFPDLRHRPKHLWHSATHPRKTRELGDLQLDVVPN